MYKLFFWYYKYIRYKILREKLNLQAIKIDIDGILLQFHISKNEGEAILFIHGLLDSSVGFRKVLEHLDKKFKIYLVDIPSFGKSSSPSEKFFCKLDIYSEIIYESLKKLDLKNITLVGHSMGGLICQHITILDNSNIIKKLVLISPGNSPHPKREEMRKLLFPKTIQDFNLLLKKLYYNLENEPSDFFKKIFISSIQNKKLDYLSENTIANEEKIFFGNKAKKINIQTKIISGLDDEITSQAEVKKLKSYIKNSELKLIPNAKHAIHLEHSKLIATEINQF